MPRVDVKAARGWLAPALGTTSNCPVNVFAIPPPKEQDDENTDPSKDSSTKDASQIVPLTKEALARAALSPTYAFARPPASPTEASSVVSSLAATPSPVGYRASNGRVYWVTNLC